MPEDSVLAQNPQWLQEDI